jgi:Fe-S oxidoreductase
MDLILAFILSGLLLAIIKRFYSRIVGMKKTTRLKITDRIALTSLWLIFPSRLLAESFTSAIYGNGSFLTGSLGAWFGKFLPANDLAYPFWWLYSISLGTFFILLPLTRYMHIPTELFLIFMRNSGIRTGDKEGTYTEVQTYSCSSCGICIDACQLNSSAGITNVQSAYLMKAIRNNTDTTGISDNCMMCGRCDTKCPVGIELSPIRMIQRRGIETARNGNNIFKKYFPAGKTILPENISISSNYSFLKEQEPEKTDVLFFAGCMTHLTPAIKNSMVKILDASGLNYKFMDEEGGVCCGRPLMLAGQDKEARELINFNSQLIWKSGAQLLVTSCPICYKIFKESYYLDAEVLHHSQFIKRLIDKDALKLNFIRKKVAYHSPCELGRGSAVYEDPKFVLNHVSRLEITNYEDSDSLCCGGSLANMKLSSAQRTKIASDAAKNLTINNPDILATACPLCKKTFSGVTSTRVADISEIVAESINLKLSPKINHVSLSRVTEKVI